LNVSALDDAAVREIFRSVLSEISQDHEYMQHLSDLGLAKSLTAGLAAARFPCAVHHVPRNIDGERKSFYVPLLDRLFVDRPRPHERELLLYLCETGGFGPYVSDLTHEFTHVAQFGRGNRRAVAALRYGALALPVAAAVAFGVAAGAAILLAVTALAGFFALCILRSYNGTDMAHFLQDVAIEVHAYYVERSDPAGMWGSFHSHEIRELVVDNVASSSYLDPEHHDAGREIATRAFDLIDALALLGKRHNELARIIFDETPTPNGEFPVLTAALRELREKHGLTDSAELGAWVNVLGTLRHYEHVNARLRAQITALAHCQDYCRPGSLAPLKNCRAD
jgi:hypothetical protein